MKGAMGILPSSLILALILVLLPPSSLAQRRSRVGPPKPLSLEQEYQVSETLRLLLEGDNLPVDKTGHEDFVLVMGNMGAGKRTMTKFLAQTHLLEAYHSIDRLLIIDRHGKISRNSNIFVSQAIFPNLIIDNATNTAFYELPSFQDNQKASLELANACLIAKVAARAKRVKLLFVLNYSSIQSGESRMDFKTLLEHAVDLVKEPVYFANSTALILTKVESSNTDQEVIAVIEAFLLRAMDDLSDIFQDEDKVLKAFDLISSFLTKDRQGNLSRIAFFKQPTTAGPLSSMPEMMEQKGRMYSVLSNMDYTPKTTDFGTSISSSAQLLTSKIVSDLRGRIKSAVNRTAGMMEDFFTTAGKEAQPSDVGRLYGLYGDLTEAVKSISPSLTPEQFFAALESSITPLNLNMGPQLLEMRNREENLVFFKESQAKDASLLGSSVPELTALLTERMRLVKKNVKALGGSLNSKVVNEMVSLGLQLERVITNITSTTMDREALAELRLLSAALHGNTTGMLRSETFNEFVRHVKAFFPPAAAPITYNYTLEEMTRDMSLVDSPGYASPFRLFHWIRPLEKAARHLLFSQSTLEGRILDEQHRETNLRFMRALQNIQDSNNQTLQAEREARETMEKSFRRQTEAVFRQMEEQRDAFSRDLSTRTAEMQLKIKELEAQCRTAEEFIVRAVREMRDYQGYDNSRG